MKREDIQERIQDLKNQYSHFSEYDVTAKLIELQIELLLDIRDLLDKPIYITKS